MSDNQPKSRREQLADEHRAHDQKIEQLRSEGAFGREVNDEYVKHQKRVGEILGKDNLPCVGGHGAEGQRTA